MDFWSSDLPVNLKAELEIMELQEKFDRLEQRLPPAVTGPSPREEVPR